MIGLVQGRRLSRSRDIAKNSFLVGLETLVTWIASFGTSVAIARIIGPEKLGYYNYIYYLTLVAGVVGTLGVPMAVRKYMADYIAVGELDKAKAVYEVCLKAQIKITFSLTLLCALAAWLLSDRSYFVSTFLIIGGMPIRILSFLPSAANQARNSLASNLPGSFGNLVTYSFIAIVSLVLGWGVNGIAAGLFIGYVVEFVLKATSVSRWLSPFKCAALDRSTKRRMLRFSGQGVVLTILALTIFDRSDLIFLRMLTTNPSYLTFFTLATSMVERVLVLPYTLMQGLNVTILNEHAVNNLASGGGQFLNHGIRYAMLIGVPALLCAAALSEPLVRLVYGNKYLPVIPLFALAAILAVPKITAGPAQTLMQAHDRQDLLIYWGIACAALNLALDLVLIPIYSVTGAIAANGISQAVSAVGIWVLCRIFLNVRISLSGPLRAIGLALVMALPIKAAAILQTGFPGVILACVLSVGIGLIVTRLLSLLEPEDESRLQGVLSKIPSLARPPALLLIRWGIRPR